jgi:hypothetical protein
MGTIKRYDDDVIPISEWGEGLFPNIAKQFFPWEQRGLVGGAVREAPLLGELFHPIKEEDIIVEARKGRGLASMYKHRDRQLKMALEYIDRQESNAPPMWFETADDTLYDNVEKQLNQNAGIYSLDEVTVTPE